MPTLPEPTDYPYGIDYDLLAWNLVSGLTGSQRRLISQHAGERGSLANALRAEAAAWSGLDEETRAFYHDSVDEFVEEEGKDFVFFALLGAALTADTMLTESDLWT